MPGLEKEVKGLKLTDGWSFDTKLGDSTPPLDFVASLDYELPPDPAHRARQINERLLFRQKLHDALRTVNQSIPRYLFRSWSAVSGGDARLNTTAAITPRAFLTPNVGPASIFEIKTANLYDDIRGHLEGRRFDTPFSSWSYSLPFALFMLPSMDDAHLSVIDTHKLKAELFIVHCGATALGDLGIPQYGREFLVFGVVEGEAHRAVPFVAIHEYLGALLGKGYLRFTWMHAPLLPISTDDVQGKKKGKQKQRQVDEDSKFDAVARAREFGAFFGRRFALPVAICLLAVKYNVVSDERLQERLMADVEVRASWSENPKFPTIAKNTPGFTKEADDAARTMMALVQKLPRAGRIAKAAGGKTERCADETDSQPDLLKQDEEVDIADGGSGGESKHLKRPARMSRAVYQLYIDMVGYDEHNEAVRG